MWLLRLEKPKNWQKFSENFKKCKFYKKKIAKIWRIKKLKANPEQINFVSNLSNP